LSNNYIISIDFGGTKILAGLLNSKGQILSRFKIPTQPYSSKLIIVKTLVKLIKDILKENAVNEESVRAICIGIPGSVNPFTGIIGTAPNLKIYNFDIRAAMEKYISIPVLIENDVNLGALGIQHFELNGKGRNFLVVFIGTGIGSALVFESKLYRGSNYYAGEIGHIVIEPDGPECGCGNNGCFEAIASRTAIAREIKKEVKRKKKGALKQFVSSNKQIKSKALALAVKKQDPIALKHIEYSCEVIGRTLANITNLLNLDLIVLGGGVIEALGKFMLPKIKAAFKENVLKDLGKGINIINTNLGDDAALYGGIALAEEMEDLLK
jgi:glucokinase